MEFDVWGKGGLDSVDAVCGHGFGGVGVDEEDVDCSGSHLGGVVGMISRCTIYPVQECEECDFLRYNSALYRILAKVECWVVQVALSVIYQSTR